MKSVVSPPDGSSDSEEGIAEEDEGDELCAEGQCEEGDSSRGHLTGCFTGGIEWVYCTYSMCLHHFFPFQQLEENSVNTTLLLHHTAPLHQTRSPGLTSPCTLFDEDIFEVSAHQINLYSCQLIGCRINTNASETRAFTGMKLIVGMVKMPAVENYQATDAICGRCPATHVRASSQWMRRWFLTKAEKLEFCCSIYAANPRTGEF